MPKTATLHRLVFSVLAFTFCFGYAFAEKPEVLESPHYRIFYSKKNDRLAGEVVKVAETVWPVLAKAYDAYDNYQTIEIFLLDEGDYANGNAIYTISRVEILVPHLNWVMRGRSNWVGNVVTHELSHVFSLRRAAYLSPFDSFLINGYTYNQKVNWSLSYLWIPLVAPTWYVEGIAQFEAAHAGNDHWDSQRDMIVRDAYLTGTLPSLGEIETFDGDWVQAERAYNTGFAFLLYLSDRFGDKKVRALAEPKPVFNFGYSVEAAFGKSLQALYEDWKKSLADRYTSFKDIPKDEIADKDIQGSFTQNLTFSRDGRYMAWLGNGDRDYSLNWIYWKDLSNNVSGQSKHTLNNPTGTPTVPTSPALPSAPAYFTGIKNTGRPIVNGHPSLGSASLGFPATYPSGFQSSPQSKAEAKGNSHVNISDLGRSEVMGSSGLEFNAEGNRLLTTRNANYNPYQDIWEYEFLSKKEESERWHRLTWNIRASYPSYHPHIAGLVVFVQLLEGSSNISTLDSTGHIHRLTRFREGQQCYNPRFTPKGDSIVFTLGVGDQEALVSISANTKAYDEFEALRDSSSFADSLYLAKGEKATFITPLENAGYRDIFYKGDTLFFSSNRKGGLYEVYARLPNDSNLYRATHARTQALEPVIAGDALYYQGYEKQHFRIFKRPLALERDGILPVTTDSLPRVRPKNLEFGKVFEKGEPELKPVAWDISPYIEVAPQFVNDTTLSNVNLRTGMDISIGNINGGISQHLGGYVSKRMDFNTPLDYGVSYGGGLGSTGAWHNRHYWEPNLSYNVDYFIQQVVDKASQTDLEDVPNTLNNKQEVKRFQRIDATYNYTNFSGGMALPFNGLQLGSGYFGFYTAGRYTRVGLTEDVLFRQTTTPLANNAVSQTQEQRATVFDDAQIHKHYMQQAYAQWLSLAAGTPLPQGFMLWTATSKWWSTYAAGSLQIPDALVAQLGQEGKSFGENILLQKDFAPWQIDAGMTGVYSWGRHVLATASVEAGTYLQKFPTQKRVLSYNRVSASQTDTTFTDVPDDNLWLMNYRLGLVNMPAYPYNFVFRGRDILKGSNLFLGSAALAFPFKVREFIPSPFLFSSFNQVQLTLMAHAGTVLDESPDRIFRKINNDQHVLLTDYGARLAFTFLMYHQVPFSFYGQVFAPYNQLKESDLQNGDYDPDNFIDRLTTQQERDAADQQARHEYLRAVKEPRFFLGLTLGEL